MRSHVTPCLKSCICNGPSVDKQYKFSFSYKNIWLDTIYCTINTVKSITQEHKYQKGVRWSVSPLPYFFDLYIYCCKLSRNLKIKGPWRGSLSFVVHKVEFMCLIFQTHRVAFFSKRKETLFNFDFFNKLICWQFLSSQH